MAAVRQGQTSPIAQADVPTGEATIDGAHATLTSGSLALHIQRDAPWNLEIQRR